MSTEHVIKTCRRHVSLLATGRRSRGGGVYNSKECLQPFDSVINRANVQNKPTIHFRFFAFFSCVNHTQYEAKSAYPIA